MMSRWTANNISSRVEVNREWGLRGIAALATSALASFFNPPVAAACLNQICSHTETAKRGKPAVLHD